LTKKDVAKIVREKKPLTKKQIIMISVAVVVLLAIIATAITLPIVLLNKNEFLPEVVDFDQNNDAYVKIGWDSVAGATSYIIEYYYDKIEEDESNVVTAMTTAKTYQILRRKGVLAFRVKVLKDNKKGEFCPWQFFNVSPLILEKTSNVGLNTNGVLSWDKVKYLDIQTLKEVPTYQIEISFTGDLVTNAVSNKFIVYENIALINQYISTLISYDEGVDEWQDVTLTVRVKALNYNKIGDIIFTDDDYEYLYNAYEENEYYESVIIINKQKYRDIKG